MQLAKARELKVFGTAGPAKQDFLGRTGVDHPIDYTREDFVEVVRRVAPEGIELVMDPIGGKSFTKSYRCLGPMGRLAIYGFSAAAGPEGKRSLLRAAKAFLATRRYHPLKLMENNTAVIGVHFGHLDARSAVLAKELAEVFRLYSAGKIKPVIGKTSALEGPLPPTATSTAGRTSARWCCVWPSRDARRCRFALTGAAGFAGAADHTWTTRLSLFVLRTALATFLLLPAFVQGQTLTLNDAINLAETHNRALQVSQLDQRKAADETSVARSHRLPSFSSTVLGSQSLSRLGLTFPRGSLGTYPNVGPIPGTTTTLQGPLKPTGIFYANMTQPLSQQWKIGLQAQFAQVGQRISEQQVRATRQTTVNDVRRLYYGILQAESGKKNLLATLESLRELDRNTRQDELQRVALRADLLNVQAQLAQAEYELLKLEDPLETQKQQLNRLMGRDVNTPLQVDPLSVADAAVPDLEEACAQALASRPEILQARLRVEQATLGRRIANADRIPDVSLSAYAVETVNLSNILPNRLIGAGIQMNWDVFDWGRKRRKVDEARLSEEQASLQLKDAEAAVVIEVTHRYRQLAEAKKEVEVAERLQTAAQEFVRVTRNQYMQKAALTSDLLKVESSLADADHRVTRALLDLATAQADLEKANGEEP